MDIDLSKLESEEEIYYFSDNGNVLGPFTLARLIEKIGPETLVYREGINWTRACEIPELKQYFPEEKKVVEKVSEKAPIPSTTPKKSPVLLIFVVFFIIGSLLVYLLFTYLDFTRGQEQAQIEQQRLTDSMAMVNSQLMLEMERDSMNDAINARIDSLNSVESELMFLQNQDYLAERIDSYYSDIVSNNFDAYNYYSDTVNQFINLMNLSPEEVNDVFTSERDYTNEEIYFDRNTLMFDEKINDVYYFTYSIQYRCFRITRNKTQECDVDIQIGFNQNFQIKSYKELKVRNLVFK